MITTILRKALPRKVVEVHDIIQRSAYTMASYVMECSPMPGTNAEFDACYQMMYDVGCQIAAAPIREWYLDDRSVERVHEKASEFAQMVIEYTLRDHSYDDVLTAIVVKYLIDYADGKETFYAYE